MNETSNQIKNNHITTDDLVFSAYLKVKGSHQIRSQKIEEHLNFRN